MIQLAHIHFGYGQAELFSDLHIDIPMGRIYGLLGKNGVGKITLLKLMTGLRFCQAGTCHVLDENSALRPVNMLRDIFFLPEEFSLPDSTVKQYQSMVAPFYPNFDNASFRGYLQRFELDPNKKLNAFSLGQKKKFLLAFGMAANTRIMLLDEPTNGLDIPSKSQFRRVLASEISDERLIIISTHQARDLERIIDAVIILIPKDLPVDPRCCFNQCIQGVGRNRCRGYSGYTGFRVIGFLENRRPIALWALCVLLVCQRYSGELQRIWELRIAWNMLNSDWLLQVKNTRVKMVATLFWGILAPFCWVVSYFRLREFEA